MDEDQLEVEKKHVKNAWIAGVISTLITLAFAISGAYSEYIRIKFGTDTWSLIDVCILAGLTYAVYKEKRYGALGLLLYFAIGKFIQAASAGQFTGGLTSLIFAYFFLQGTRATFKIHKYKIGLIPNESKKLKRGIAYYFTFIVIAIIILGLSALLVVGYYSPETEVISGRQLKKEYADFVKKNKLTDSTENIQYWYSDGFMDFKNGFYFFTEKKIILYNSDWAIPKIEIPLKNIRIINFEKQASSWENGRISLSLKDNTTIDFPLSSEKGGDDKFYNRLMELWAPFRENNNSD